MARSYGRQAKSSYKPSKKHLPFRRSNDNYDQLYRELTVLHHQADADDLLETMNEINRSSLHQATRDAERRNFFTHTVYVTLDKAIGAYRHKQINEKQFNSILYRAQEQLSDALHERSAKELRKKKPGSMRLTDIVSKEVLKQAAAALTFMFALLSFDQAQITGMAVSTVGGGYDYYSLFGFLFLALATLLFLTSKDR